MKLSSYQVEDLIKNCKNRLFTVWFTKRTDGTLRKMTCRLGVKKFLKGGQKPYSDEDKGLITVAEFKSASIDKGHRHTFIVEYRTIPLDSIKRLAINGKIYENLKLYYT